jgi:hypothetical protein
MLPDGECKYDPDSGERGPGKVIVLELAFFPSASDLFVMVNHR